MADDFADEILRKCGLTFDDGFITEDVELFRRAITLTRVRTKREDANTVSSLHDVKLLRAEADALERQMREDGK